MPKKLTLEEFVNKANLVHGKGTYDYSKSVYVKSLQKIIIICPEHGEFDQTPNKHLKGQGCPKCANNKNLTLEEFVNKANLVHGKGTYDYSGIQNFENCSHDVDIICPKHGVFKQKPSLHLRGQGCKICGIAKSASTRSMSLDEFKKKSKALYGEHAIDYSKSNYTNFHTAVELYCNLHNISFKQQPSNHLNGKMGCFECAKEKKKSTNMRVYGFDHHLKSPIVRDAIESAMTESLGVSNPFMSKDVQEKIRSDRKKRTGREHHMQYHIDDQSFGILEDPVELEARYNKIGGVELARCLGVNSYTVYDRLHQFGIQINHGASYAEQTINDFIQSLGHETIQNDRTVLDGKEIDILIPSLNLGIEFDGIHWHSSRYIESTVYHRDKTDLAEAKGIRLIHIFENEWIHKRELVLSKISNICGVREERVYARKTQVMEITNKKSRRFYDANHIQGFGTTSTKTYGLYSEELKLVACMSFQKKFDGEWDLTRFATSCNVIGGFSKLLKHFIKSESPKSIISFADRRWSRGDVYLKNGFTYEYDTKPNYYYVVGDDIVRKEKFRHSRMKDNLETYDPNLSEKENTEANGIYRIYDCGLMKFRMDLE